MATVEAVTVTQESFWAWLGQKFKNFGQHVVTAAQKVGGFVVSGAKWLWNTKAVQWVTTRWNGGIARLAGWIRGPAGWLAAPIFAMLFAPRALAVALFTLLMLGIITVVAVRSLLKGLKKRVSEEDYEVIEEVIAPVVDALEEDEIEEETEEIEALMPEWEAEVKASDKAKPKAKAKAKAEAKAKAKVEVEEAYEEIAELVKDSKENLVKKLSEIAEPGNDTDEELQRVVNDGGASQMPITAEETYKSRILWLEEALDDAIANADDDLISEMAARTFLVVKRQDQSRKGKIPADSTTSVVYREFKSQIAEHEHHFHPDFKWNLKRVNGAMRSEEVRLDKIAKLKAQSNAHAAA